MTRKLDLKRAADLFRISIEPDRLAEIESALRVKIDEMEVYEDELLVVSYYSSKASDSVRVRIQQRLTQERLRGCIQCRMHTSWHQ